MQKEEMQREIAHEQRMQQLRKENAREAELDAKIAALWPSSTTSSAQAPPPESQLADLIALLREYGELD